jgi:aryl-alcohol dehydrogenase-like predicted oxidoreductase
MFGTITCMGEVVFGCGLIAIGRAWGSTPRIPTETEAQEFLETAYESGVRFFDTAPGYGLSEQRLGRFLKGLSNEDRGDILVATKFGENWNPETGESFIDHSFDGLRRCVDESLARLGSVNLIQLHRPSVEVLQGDTVWEAVRYACDSGVMHFGVSGNTPDVLAFAQAKSEVDTLQLPLNEAHPGLASFLRPIAEGGWFTLVNRPMQMGEVTKENDAEDKYVKMVSAYRFILQHSFDGVVLSGTSNPVHLHENIVAFRDAMDLTKH